MRLFSAFFLFVLFSNAAFATVKTSVHGTVRDARTREPLPYVTVNFEGIGIGVRTDIEGHFYLETDRAPKSVRFQYVGYQTLSLPIAPGEHNELEVFLEEGMANLTEVVVRPKKYSRKNNPAVDLVEEVFRHKDRNRKESLDYYSFEKYEKLQVDLNNITDQYRRKWFFRPFRFIFNNVDTNAVTQKVALPLYLRERLLDGYYRKDPQRVKAVLRGERISGFADKEAEDDGLGIDNEGVSAFMSTAFQDVDIYEPQIQLLGTAFVGPLSSLGQAMYRYYIIDTVEVNGVKYADLFFAPKNKADLAFMGNMLVALDSTYAVMKVEMGVPKGINLNYVSDLQIMQTYERVGEGDERHLMVTEEQISVDLKVLKRSQGRSLLTHKKAQYRNFSVNQPLPDSLFAGNTLLDRDTGNVRRRPESWWLDRRFQPLNRTEAFLERMVDSIRQVPAYKFMVATGKLLGSGYQRVRWIDIGKLNTLFSYNDIEGQRFRLGFKTNARLHKPLVLEAYFAYGLRDQRWKYYFGGIYSFNGKVPRAFPQNQLGVTYQEDLRIPGLGVARLSEDNVALALQRGTRDRMLFNQVLRVEYKKEFNSQFSFSIAALSKRFTSAGLLAFQLSGGDPDVPRYADRLQTSELGLILRYAPNQQFYNGPNNRRYVPGKYPIFSMSYKAGFRGVLDGQYDFQKVTFTAEKRFFVPPFGHSDWTLNLGRTWGTVPYPLLEVHPANQSYLYDWYAFNLMNFMEFVSDKYASFQIQHNFNGLIFNRVPLVRKWHWRENFSMKLLYGGLDQRNRPDNTEGLFRFPVNAKGQTLTHTLEQKPYIEMSAGISNLFRFLRVDYVWRIHYTDLPDAPKWGVRAMFAPKF
jgi:hypothetical protein